MKAHLRYILADCEQHWRKTAVAALLFLAGCCFCPPERAADTRGADQRAASPREVRPLKILTWNIWMMPPISLHSLRNTKRASAIADELLKRDFDVICLEKVFDDCAREVLVSKLCGRYSYRWGPINTKDCFKFNGGVWVLSKFPMEEIREIEFNDCGGIECLSAKGAILLRGKFNGNPFELVATHLQGEEGPDFAPANVTVRENQMKQIARELLAPNSHEGIPIIICGDFGTPRKDGAKPNQNSKAYDDMLKILGVVNDEKERITLNDNLWRNALAQDNTGRADEEDYILLKSNGISCSIDRDVVVMRNSVWDTTKHRQDLSYRYGVSAAVSFPQAASESKPTANTNRKFD